MLQGVSEYSSPISLVGTAVNLTDFVIDLDTALPCPSDITLQLTVTTDQGVFTIDYRLTVGPSCIGCPPGCDATAIAPISQLLAVKYAFDLSILMQWQADAVASGYNLRYVEDKTLIPARQGNGSDVCLHEITTQCVHWDTVRGAPGTIHHYNVIGACGATEAAE